MFDSYFKKINRLSGNLRGVLLMFVATICFSVMHALIRYMSAELHPFELAFFRNLFGFLVNPQEIEAYIQQHIDVEECQVIGVDGPRGTRPVGFVILRENATTLETDLTNHCLAGMAKFKVPYRIFPVSDFPTTTGANGTKIQRSKLREMAIQMLTTESDG